MGLKTAGDKISAFKDSNRNYSKIKQKKKRK